MSIPEESSTQQPTDAATHLPSQQERSSYLSPGGDWTDDTPVAIDPPPGTSTTNIGMTSSLPSPLLVRVAVPIEFEGVDVDIPLNDLSEDDDAADEAAGFASQSSVGSLSLDDQDLAVSSAAAKHVANDEEVSRTSAGTGASSTSITRGRRPSFQAQRRPSQRRRSSATSFEMHDSLIFEELNKLVEDDTDSDGEDDDDGDHKDDHDEKKIPASRTSTIDEAPATQEELALVNNQGHRAGRRGSSRSLASVIEDMELDEDDINDIDNNDDAKAGPKMPVVMQFEQRILDRLGQQDDKRSLVRTRSEASLHSGRSVHSRKDSGGRVGGLSGSSSPLRNEDTQNTIQQRYHALRGSRAVQSERVLTGRAREVWPEVQMEATSGEDQVGNDDDKKKNTGKSGKGAASNKFSTCIKSWFRGLGKKNN